MPDEKAVHAVRTLLEGLGVPKHPDREWFTANVKPYRDGYKTGKDDAVRRVQPSIDLITESPLEAFFPERVQAREPRIIGAQPKHVLVATLNLIDGDDGTVDLDKTTFLVAASGDISGSVYAVARYSELGVALSTFKAQGFLGQKYFDTHQTAGIPITGPEIPLPQDIQIDFSYRGFRIGSLSFKSEHYPPEAFASLTQDLRQHLLTGNIGVVIAGAAPAGIGNLGYVGEQIATANEHDATSVVDLKYSLGYDGLVAALNAGVLHLNQDELSCVADIAGGSLEPEGRRGEEYKNDTKMAIDLYALCLSQGRISEDQIWVATFQEKGGIVIRGKEYIEFTVPDLKQRAREVGGSDAGAGNNLTAGLAVAYTEYPGHIERMAQLAGTYGMLGAIGLGCLGAGRVHYNEFFPLVNVKRLDHTPNPLNPFLYAKVM